jgi:transcriptional regulator with XRE-family HTH domain
MAGRMSVRTDRVRMLREAADLQQNDAAYRMGISQAHLSRIESGQVQSVGIAVLKKMADMYSVNIEYLIGVSDDPTPRDKVKMTEDESVLLYIYHSFRTPGFRATVVKMAQHLLQLEQDTVGETPEPVWVERPE